MGKYFVGSETRRVEQRRKVKRKTVKREAQRRGLLSHVSEM